MSRTVRVVGAPTDYGSSRRGVDMGPSAIRYAGLAAALDAAGVESVDAGNVSVPIVESTTDDSPIARFLPQTETVCTALADAVATTLERDQFPLVLGGDHSVAIGSLAGTARDARVGVVWFDAHADFNTPETSPSGNVHGMPLAAALGHGAFAETPWTHAPALDEENLVWVGLRSVDEEERRRVRDSAATAFTMADIDDLGISTVVERALDVATDGTDGLHVSLDLDWLEPTEAPGVGTPVKGGVSYREAHFALEAVAERDRQEGVLRSMDVVEVNPILDDRNGTAELATDLVSSAFGKRVL